MSVSTTHETEWKGLIPYDKALQMQESWVQEISQGRSLSRILGLEHPHVITLGRRSKQDPVIPEGPVVWTERGGEATLHSEGQLVIYPLMKLRPRFEVRGWVEFLLEVTRQTLRDAGVETRTGGQAGLWTGQGKIAFLGIRVKNGVSMHGLSINVNNDLSLFSPIKACGVSGAALDSLAEQGVRMSTHDLFVAWLRRFESSLPS